MWGRVVICCLLLVSAVQASQVVLRFTARAFMPAACYVSYSELAAFWAYASNEAHGSTLPTYPDSPTSDISSYIGGSTAQVPTPNLQSYTTSESTFSARQMCPIWNDILAGNYNGHPDFEASGEVYAEGCSNSSGINLGPKVFNNDGLPKPVYCESNGVYATDDRCGWNAKPNGSPAFTRVTSTGPSNYDLWYRDSKMYNMRSGYTLTLTAVAESDTFQFSATASDTGALAGFFPLASNGIFPCEASSQATLNCSNGGRTWPTHVKQAWNESDTSLKKIFSFTDEHHSFFQLHGTEIFSFLGDDDVWVFLNEKLAIDLGGLHSQSQSQIDLSSEVTRAQLGMEIGGIYALDMFHAERHTSGCNFQITTSLTAGCTVTQSGSVAYAWSPSTIIQDWKLVGGPTWGIVKGENILLTQAGVQQSVGYAILQQEVNVGNGFIAQFSFTATSKGEGFVFMMRRDSIINMNGGTGGNLGFLNTENSIGIVFDFCVDRDTNPADPACNDLEISLHYLANGGLNSVGASTRVLFAPLYYPVVLNNGSAHNVIINYFANPPWLEVIVDEDLLLQNRSLNIAEVLGGGSNAFMGFSAATGFTSSSISITDVTITTVGIQVSNTQAIGLPNSTNTLSSVADGFESVVVTLQNFDLCGNDIEFGGFSYLAKGILTLVEEINGTSTGRLLSTLQINGNVEDNNNGLYDIEFTTTVPGIYSLEVFFGAGCFVDGSNSGALTTNPPTATCFSQSRANSVVFQPVAPTATPVFDNPAALGSAALTGIGVAAGVITLVGSILIFAGIRSRNQWRKDKAFIEAGRLAAAERGVDYLGDTELDNLQNRLQATLHALQAERARKLQEGDQTTIIEELLRQKGELQEMVRRIKIRRDGGDPDMPPPGLGTRVRKSFAATRVSVSRGLSMRLSRGLSSFEPYDNQTTWTAGNPLFNRMSQALGMRAGSSAAASSQLLSPAELAESIARKPRPPPPPLDI